MAWLLQPVFDAITAQQQNHEALSLDVLRSHVEMAKWIREALDGVGRRISALPDHTMRFQALEGQYLALAQAIRDVRLSVGEIGLMTPRLSAGTLMAWEAIAYASEKYERDTQQHGMTDRQTEVLAWAAAYLHDNHWPIPEADVLVSLLNARDQLEQHRIAGKFR